MSWWNTTTTWIKRLTPFVGYKRITAGSCPNGGQHVAYTDEQGGEAHDTRLLQCRKCGRLFGSRGT